MSCRTKVLYHRNMYNYILLFLPLVFNVCSAYKLLVFFPYPGKSHSILGEGYVRLLLEAGHEVTYVTPIPLKTPHPKLRQVEVSSNLKFSNEHVFSIQKLIQHEMDLTDMTLITKIMHNKAHACVMHENIQKLFLDTYEEFDAVIVEWLYSELYAGVSAVFNCPYIWSSSMEPHSMVLRLIDEIPNPAYTPDHMAPIEPHFTFWERVGELWRVLNLQYIKWNIFEKEKKSYREAYGPAVTKRGRTLPPYQEIIYNGSLMFGNSHVSSGIAVRLPQNYISIAGYHISNERLILSEDLQRVMDSSYHGVIYFSLGSTMKCKSMPDEMKKGLLKLFGSLKQTVIWKLEETLQDVPMNVHIVEWAPQQSILAHSNCVLFITHGGLLSTTETLHYGVPIIGIPLYADQFINIKRAVSKGFALQVELGHDMPIKLKAAIEESLSTPRYREKANELSFIFHDRPTSPGAEVVHWVEHVVRTGGALHLRSPALSVPLYQKTYLDLIAVIAITFIIIFKMTNYLFKLLIGKRKVDSKKKYS